MLSREVLVSYPVEPGRLDIFNQFLTPAGCAVRKHKITETTEIMLQMVSAGRAVAALPRWLVEQFSDEMSVTAVKLGKTGVQKTLCLALRAGETRPAYQQQFIDLAKSQAAV
jgi:LysR family transcriptional regulator for metE and metH